MSRPRRFLKCEIVDAARAAAEYNMEVRLMPNGEMRFIPASDQTPKNQSIEQERQSEADEALSEWMVKHGGDFLE
ncbi:MAG: hypothetical protein AAGF25_04395 [Pseudomonadota bacterium]